MGTRFFPVEDRFEAAAQGKKTYYGPSCKVCGGIDRYTSNGGCIKCQKRRANDRSERIRKLLMDARSQANAKD